MRSFLLLTHEAITFLRVLRLLVTAWSSVRPSVDVVDLAPAAVMCPSGGRPGAPPGPLPPWGCPTGLRGAKMSPASHSKSRTAKIARPQDFSCLSSSHMLFEPWSACPVSIHQRLWHACQTLHGKPSYPSQAQNSWAPFALSRSRILKHEATGCLSAPEFPSTKQLGTIRCSRT